MSRVWKKVLSGFFVNMAAFWFGMAFASLSQYFQPFWLSTLTLNIANGIVCLFIAVMFEKDLYDE